MKQITSRHHPLVSLCRDLARGREVSGRRILLDGQHLLEEARKAGVAIETTAVTPRFAATPGGAPLVEALQRDGGDVVEVSEAVMEALSPVATPSGLVAVAARPTVSLDQVVAGHAPLVLIACDIQDPGNVGAIVRAVEAGGATGVVFCGASADPYGWKALRGSMGSSLRLPVAGREDAEAVMHMARELGLDVMATVPRGGESLYGADLTVPVALLLGGEGPGLAESLIALADRRLSIPMRPPVESLNVAVAAAVFVYEASRQRAIPPASSPIHRQAGAASRDQR